MRAMSAHRSMLGLQVVVVTVALGCPPMAWAVPEGDCLSDVIARCPLVVEARIGKGGLLRDKRHEWVFELEFLRVLKGTASLGMHEVKCSDFPTIGRLKLDVKAALADDVRFFAFLGDGITWRHAAWRRGDALKQQKELLWLNGFCDHNAYVIAPGIVTREQLEQYVKTGKLLYRVRGPVCFAEKHSTQFRPGGTTIELEWDAAKGERALLRGLPTSTEAVANTQAWVGGFYGPPLEVDVWKSLARPLKFVGELTNTCEAAHVMQARFYVSEPDALCEADLLSYVRDPRKGNSVYTLQLDARMINPKDAPRKLTLTSGWAIGGDVLAGWGGQPLRGKSASTSSFTFELDREHDLVVVFDYSAEHAATTGKLGTLKDGHAYFHHYADSSGSIFVGRRGATLARREQMARVAMFKSRLVSVSYPRVEKENVKK